MKDLADFRQLRGEVLRSVSRSFYLSLRILPRPLRDPLSLAYLLARATDTIADTAEAPVALRKDSLHVLAGLIQETTPAATGRTLAESFAPLQSNDAERILIQNVPALLEWLKALSPSDREEIRNVLEKINRGQMLDLERFESASGEMRALSTAADLDEYTYLVAGCVGEFWTRLCFAHVENFCDRPETEMLAMGALYGRGLQLVNILRDAGEDLRHGRCYFPADELNRLGLTAAEVADNARAFEPVLGKWLRRAQEGIAAGIDYASAIRSRRIRFATALPALIGARTLALLRNVGAGALKGRVKVSRDEVRRMILSSAIASPRSLRAKFEKLQGTAI